MNDTLKAAGRIGAELGAAKAEIQTLRTALLAIDQRNDNPARFDQEIDKIVRNALSQQSDHVRDAAQMMVPSEILKAIAWGDRDDAAEAIGSLRCLLADHEGEDEIAFPDSPEPTDTFTAVDMATAAAQGFRDGQAAVEQAPAEDEHQPVGWHTDDHLTDKSATTYDREVADRWRGKGWPVYELYARPAQTEQQPIRLPQRKNLDGLLDPESKRAGRAYNEALEDVELLNTAPIAQTAPQPEPSGLNDDSKEAAMQKAFELGGLEDGSYHLESDELELVIRAALSAQAPKP
jgi:hypothetical protein